MTTVLHFYETLEKVSKKLNADRFPDNKTIIYYRDVHRTVYCTFEPYDLNMLTTESIVFNICIYVYSKGESYILLDDTESIIEKKYYINSDGLYLQMLKIYDIYKNDMNNYLYYRRKRRNMAKKLYPMKYGIEVYVTTPDDIRNYYIDNIRQPDDLPPLMPHIGGREQIRVLV